MSGRDGDDEESTEGLWDEIEEFAEDDPSEVEAFTDPDSNDTEEIIEADPVETESVDDSGPTDDPTEPFGDGDSIAGDDQLPNTEDAPDADEVFDEMDVSAVDGEALWDELAGAEAEAESFEGDEAATSDVGEAAGDISEAAAAADIEADDPVDADPVESSLGSAATVDQSTGSEGDTETLVDKRAYCQQCPYFSEPPAVSCGHAGTEIIEVLKDGRFRVRNCPVVTDTGPDRTILNDGN